MSNRSECSLRTLSCWVSSPHELYEGYSSDERLVVIIVAALSKYRGLQQLTKAIDFMENGSVVILTLSTILTKR